MVFNCVRIHIGRVSCVRTPIFRTEGRSKPRGKWGCQKRLVKSLLAGVPKAGKSLLAGVPKAGKSLLAGVPKAGKSLLAVVPKAGKSLLAGVPKAGHRKLCVYFC